MPKQPLHTPSSEFLDEALPFDLAHLFEDLLHELYVFDRDTLRFIMVNRAARENLGYSSEEFVQMTPLDLKRDYTFERFDALLVPLRGAQEKKIRFETFHTRKGGTRYPVEVHLQTGEWGGEAVFIAMVLDISERIHSQEAFQRSERRFRTIFEQAGVGVALIQTDTSVYVRVNQRYCDIVGRSVQELMGGLTFQDITHPDDLVDQLANMERMISGEIADFTMEKRFLHKDGSWVWANLTISPAWEKEDLFRQHIVIIQDITQSKKAREELHQKSTLLKNILDSSEDLIFVKDRELRNVLSNRSFASMLGKEPEELIGKTDEEAGWDPKYIVGDPESVIRGYARDDQEALAGNRVHNPYDPAPIRGKIRIFDTKKFPLLNEDNEIVGVLGIARDVTARYEEENRRLELERQVQHAQKLESLGILAGGIAHDFNNLLTGILGYSDLALSALAPGTSVYGYLEEVVKGARQAAALTQQMLAYSGKGRFLVKSLDLAKLIEEMGRLLEISISKKCILRYEFIPGLPLVEADASQIRQIVMNLVINASEAIGDRSGVIAVSTGAMFCDKAYFAETYLDEDLAEGLYVYLEVSDNGCGMSPETQAKIFDPFFTTKFTGRGLGLAAVLGIVRGHRGAVKVYSELGRGTTIKVLFPISEQQGVEMHLAPVAPVGWRTSGLALIVDDEESVRALARVMLEKMGFSVMTAADGREAVEIFRQKSDQITLVLLDMTMPHLNGEETYREMRRIRSGVCTILSSGYNEQSATNRFAGKGLAGFIQKPYRYEGLRDVVQKAIEGQSLPSPPSPNDPTSSD